MRSVANTIRDARQHPGTLRFILASFVYQDAIGTIIGSIAVGRPADSVGRRGILFVLAIFYFVSAIGCAFAWSWGAFMVFRFLGGLAVGGASVVSPMYIAEVAPPAMRGEEPVAAAAPSGVQGRR